jgi:hypothetical protein
MTKAKLYFWLNVFMACQCASLHTLKFPGELVLLQQIIASSGGAGDVVYIQTNIHALPCELRKIDRSTCKYPAFFFASTV